MYFINNTGCIQSHFLSCRHLSTPETSRLFFFFHFYWCLSDFRADPDLFFRKRLDRFKHCSLSWLSAQTSDDFRDRNLKQDKDEEKESGGGGIDVKLGGNTKDLKTAKNCMRLIQSVTLVAGIYCHILDEPQNSRLWSVFKGKLSFVESNCR